MATPSVTSFAQLQKDAADKKAALETAFDAFEADPTEAKGQAAVDAVNASEQSSLAFILGMGISTPPKR